MYLTPILEFSRDPLSDTTPTWTDVTAYLLEATWANGKKSELDDPEPGGATFVLDNRDRRFEPEFVAGAYYPDIVPLRRFRWRIQNGVGSGTIYNEGIWYVTEWEQVWDGHNQEAVVHCVDGFELLSLDNLPALDPPTAQSYPDVVNFDEPWWYGRLGEATGTRVVAVSRRVGKRGNRKRRRKVRTERVERIAEEAVGVAGPSGVYQVATQVQLGQPGLVVGDSDTAVRFTRSGSTGGRIRIPLTGVQNLSETQELTVEAIIKVGSLGSGDILAAGPSNSGGFPIWIVTFGDSDGDVELWVHDTGGAYSIAATAGPGAGIIQDETRHHVIVTYDNQSVWFYVDDVEYAGNWGPYAPVPLDSPAENTFLYIGADPDGGAGSNDLTVDEFAVYERALPAARRTAHYDAAANRGLPLADAGDRISDIAISDPWDETSIVGGTFDVQPQMMVGQSKLEEILETVDAESPNSLFFFEGAGDPRYLPWDYQGTGSVYNQPSITFGNQAGEVPFADLTVIYDDLIFNEVTTSIRGGEGHTVEDTASQAAYRRRAFSDQTDLLLEHHADCETVAQELLSKFSNPELVITELELDGDNADARLQILAMLIGYIFRVKHRPKGGTAIDRVVTLLGWEKHLGRGDGADRGKLTATWHVSRGFNAAESVWHLGVVGFTELGTTTVLG